MLSLSVVMRHLKLLNKPPPSSSKIQSTSFGIATFVTNALFTPT